MKNKAYEPNPGVGCDVTNCSVQNEKAASKGETYCSTFCPRGTN